MGEKIPKPQMRRLLQAKLKVGVTGACLFSILTGIAWKYGVCEPRKQKYIDFYKTYDPEKRIKLMCQKGLLQSCDENNY